MLKTAIFPMKTITVDKPLLSLGLALGEGKDGSRMWERVKQKLILLTNTGCVWDSRTQRLYFVDIDGRKVFTYEPKSGVCGFQLFDKKMTALALRETELGVSPDDSFGVTEPAADADIVHVGTHAY
jgi:hypothetical protein